MAVAGGGEALVAGPAVGRHGRRPGDVAAEKAAETAGRSLRHDAQAQTAQAPSPALAAAGLDRAGDLALAAGAAARLAWPGTADIGLVGLDPRRQRRPLGSHHRLSDLVQPAPGGLIAAEAHLPLELHRRDPALARGHEIDRQEPPRQPGLGLLEDRAREQRMLPAAVRAFVDQARLVRPGPLVAAGRTAKS